MVAMLIGVALILQPAQTARALPSDRGAIIWAAGDIASCSRYTDSRVGNMIAASRGTVLTLGDHAYPTGSPEDFVDCYDPAWGLLKSRTQPAPGNHEYETKHAAGYFGYFGERARSGYYAIWRGEWRIYSLNSEDIDRAQTEWLMADLEANPAPCVLAVWHKPLFTSRLRGGAPSVKPFWDILNAAGADVILNGHAHSYERFAPQTPDGLLADDGIREFVVGTGGARAGSFGEVAPNSEVQHTGTWGALRMRLAPGSYSWEFRWAWGEAFTDTGTASCH